MSIEQVKQAIFKQWQTMLNNGRIPVMEYKLNNGEWLEVDIALPVVTTTCPITGKQLSSSIEGSYISFSFDQGKYETFFDGNIKGANGYYKMPLDEYFDNLDYYLQEIARNIEEGFILANDLYCEDCE